MVEKWKNMSNEELALEYQQTNNDLLFQYFTERNKNLVRYFARKLLRKHPDWKDAIDQQGRLAIWEALKHFDKSKTAKFSTYFYYYMLRAMQHLFREYHSIKLPFYVILNLDKFIENNKNSIFNISSLDTPVINSDGESDCNVLDLIESDDNVERNIEDVFMKEELLKNINKLKPREARIIDSYFGISDGIPKTLQILGDKYGVTRERIRQIIVKGINKLREYYNISDTDN